MVGALPQDKKNEVIECSRAIAKRAREEMRIHIAAFDHIITDGDALIASRNAEHVANICKRVNQRKHQI